MRGLMQEWPLLVHTFIDHAKIHHGEREIVTRKLRVIFTQLTILKFIPDQKNLLKL